MISVSKDVVALIYHLLPGFVTAWVFYGLTSHPKSSSFERVVQALIFTALIQAIVIPLGMAFVWIGQVLVVGQWNQSTNFLWSILVAIILGHLLALGANSNWYHNKLNEYGVTSRTSLPSQWFSAFHSRRRYVVLHLAGGRRLQGWPNEWPDDPAEGHFIIEEPAWILDDNSVQELHTDEAIVIKGADVEMVEFLRLPDEIENVSGKITVVEQRLVLENEKENDERSQTEEDPENDNLTGWLHTSNGGGEAGPNKQEHDPQDANAGQACNSSPATTEEG